MTWLWLWIITTAYMIIPNLSYPDVQPPQERTHDDITFKRQYVPPSDYVDEHIEMSGDSEVGSEFAPYGLKWRDIVEIEDHYNPIFVSKVIMYQNNYTNRIYLY